MTVLDSQLLRKYCLERALDQSRIQLSKGEVVSLTNLIENAKVIKNFILGSSSND